MLKLIKKSGLVAFPAVIMGLTPVQEAFGFELEEASIYSINEAFDQGILNSEQLVQLYINRINTYDDAGPNINSVLSINPNALSIARDLDIERQTTGPRSPLHGIPVLLKDNYNTFDIPTTGGSAALAGSQTSEDAFVVKQLREAGAIIFGKAEMDEFAISGGGYSSIGGVVLNPYKLTRTSAGSSGGTGAAIASNFAVFGTGSDTGGSIRTPCSFQGLVCIRPTRGLVSVEGVIPFVLSRDAVGPMARNVTDAALALGVMGEYDPNNPTMNTAIAPPPLQLDKFYSDYTQFLDPNALNGARLGIVTNYLGTNNGVDPELNQLVLNAIETMEGLGATVVDITFENSFLQTVSRTYGAATPVEQKQYLEEYLATLDPQYPKTITELIAVLDSPPISTSSTPSSILGTLRSSENISATEAQNYIDRAINATPGVRNTFLSTLDTNNIDAFIFPTVNTFARSAFGTPDPTFVTPSGTAAPVRQVEIASSSGLPDITVPIGFSSQGLPATLSFTGRPYSESRLLGLAYSFEQATMFRQAPSLLLGLGGESIAVPEPTIIPAVGSIIFGVFFLKAKKRAKKTLN